MSKSAVVPTGRIGNVVVVVPVIVPLHIASVVVGAAKVTEH
jgi:hypothetical protein